MSDNTDNNLDQIKRFISVIDPDIAQCERIATVFSPSSILVKKYVSAEDFLSDSHTVTPCCLIIGLDLPGIDTAELIHILILREYNTPIIVLGNEDNLPEAVTVMRAGALDFIKTPFTDHKLKTSVENMMSMVS